jgi:hypothetical protein
MQAITPKGNVMDGDSQQHVQESSPDLTAFNGRRRWREPHFRNDLAAMRAMRVIAGDGFAAIDTLPRPSDTLLNAAHATNLVLFLENSRLLSTAWSSMVRSSMKQKYL